MTPDEHALALRLSALADDAPTASLPGRSALVRRRAAAVRRRRTALTGAGLAAAVVLVAPLPALLRDADPVPLAGSAAPRQERVVATFAFPDQGAVAEVLELPEAVPTGRVVELVVRVRTERGRAAGVDLTWGDGQAVWLDGGARCTPDAGPTVVDLRAEHVYDAPGRYVVRAAPQVLTGCEDGAGRSSPDGAQAAQREVEVR